MIIFGGVGLGEKISWQCGGNKSKELRTRGGGCEESRGMHAFLKGVLKCAICFKESGWASWALHLPKVSANDKARKVRKKEGENNIIY